MAQDITCFALYLNNALLELVQTGFDKIVVSRPAAPTGTGIGPTWGRHEAAAEGDATSTPYKRINNILMSLPLS